MDDQLDPDERVLHEARPDRTVCLITPLLLLGVFVLGMIMAGGSNRSDEMLSLGISVVLVSAALLLVSIPKLVVYYFTAVLTVTDRRILLRKGFIRREQFEIMLRRVEGLGVTQHILERITKSGAVVVTGTGAGRQVMHWIDDPWSFRDVARRQLQRIDDDRNSR